MGIIVAAFLALGFRPRPSNLDRFWQPVLDERSVPVINLPTTNTFQMEPEAMQQFGQLKPDELMKIGSTNMQAFHNWHTSLPVLQAALSVALALQRRGETPILRMSTELSSDELRGHPGCRHRLVFESVDDKTFPAYASLSSESPPTTTRRASGTIRIRDARGRCPVSSPNPRIRTMQLSREPSIP